MSDIGRRHSNGGSAGDGLVLVTAPGFDPDGEQVGARLHREGLVVNHVGPRGDRSPSELAELAASAVAGIVSAEPFTADVFAAAPGLRVLARLGVGVDSIDLDAATRHGVVVTTTPGLNDETCADHTLALMLAAVRRIAEHHSSVRNGEWNRGGALTPWDLHGKRVGVVGYGRIGRAVVRRLGGFGTEIKVFDPVAEVEPGLAAESLDELLSWAQIVTMHAPLTDQTQGLIGAAEIAALGPDAILINTSRGPLIDEVALLEALASGRLRAAALDVFVDEPPRAAVAAELPNLLLSPHIGGLSREAIEAMTRQCVQQVLDVLAGRPTSGVVNPDALAGDR